MRSMTAYGQGRARADRDGPSPEQARRAERRTRLQAFVDTDEWRELVAGGLRGRRRRTMEDLAAIGQLTEQEMREKQAEFRLLTALIEQPVAYLAQYEEGDE